MKLRPITKLTDIYGMRVVLRLALNVPFNAAGTVDDHFRIRRALPTLKYLIERGARVVIITHVGRNPENSTESLVPLLAKHIPVTFVDGLVEENVLGSITHMKEGSAVMLENLRSHEGEVANDDEFAQLLASYGDFYVNDAFPVSHRQHASIVGLPKYLPSFAGVTFMEEYNELSKAFTPKHPSLFILGGIKFETKQPLIEAYGKSYTHSFIGGALANDFMKARGYEIGKSKISAIDHINPKLVEQENILTPLDVIAATGGVGRNARADSVLPHETIYDTGPESLEMLKPLIQTAKTILWNGPLGDCERGFCEGTDAVARMIAESDAYSIVGGGDTVAAIEKLDLFGQFGFVSTAGGAMLEFLEKKTLPGIEALYTEEK